MKFFRQVYRVLAVVAWCVLMPAAAPVDLYLLRSDWDRKKRGAWWTRLWARGAAKIIGLKLTVHGEIPEASGELVISNHTGYLDVLAHASVFCIRFAPKAEIRHWPFFGLLTSLNQPIWIDRKHPGQSAKYAEDFKETLQNDLSLLVYPEGTSTDGKHGLLPFKSTPFEAAIQSNAAIRPTLVFVREEPAGAGPAPWFGGYKFLPHLLNVLGLKKIFYDMYIMDVQHPKPGETRKELALRLHELMMEEYRRHTC